MLRGCRGAGPEQHRAQLPLLLLLFPVGPLLLHPLIPDAVYLARGVADGPQVLGDGAERGALPRDLRRGLSRQVIQRRVRTGPRYGLLLLLATPFPHTQAWNPDNYVHADERPRPVDAITEDDYFDVRQTSGSLIIAEFGCGAFHRLVITGPARGQVWFDDRPSDGGLTPETDFRTWYETWLHDQPAPPR